ncbi:MAG: efflux RND transporter periplasmic adaptor subunit [Phycisphaerae bacterium]
MEASKGIKEQLGRLRIDKAHRPATPARASRRGRLWAVVAVLLAVGAAAYGWRARLTGALATGLHGPAEVSLITAVLRDEPGAPPILTATGKIVSDHRVNVATKVSGQIVELSFEQGDFVRQGQVIARIEDVNYKARRDNAAAKLERSKARLEYAGANFDRVKRLYATDNAPEIEHANIKSECEAARAQVAADAADLTEAQWRLDECAVKAPINGVVLTRNVEVGDFVAAEGGFGGMANSQFATIADMTKLRVEVDISELDIARIKEGMPCRVTPDAYKDRHYDGFVLWVDPGANYSKATVQVKVRINDPDPFLRVEGTARVDFVTARSETAAPSKDKTIWLPASAVRLGASPTYATVFVYRDGRINETAVSIRGRTDRQVEIVSGLTPGSRVVARPTDELRDGQSVRPAGAE